MGDFVIPIEPKARAVFYQQRMLAIQNQLIDPAVLTEFQLRQHYKQMCQWDSARVERDKALSLINTPFASAPVPAHVAAIANILLP